MTTVARTLIHFPTDRDQPSDSLQKTYLRQLEFGHVFLEFGHVEHVRRNDTVMMILNFDINKKIAQQLYS